MKRDNTVAAFNGNEFLDIVARLSIVGAVPNIMVASCLRPFVGDGSANGDVNVIECVAAVGYLDELLVVATFGVGNAMESVGAASRSADFNFGIATGVVWLAVLVDIIGLLQEVVVWSADGAIRGGEDSGFVEAESGNA